jgi:hypothetical protein
MSSGRQFLRLIGITLALLLALPSRWAFAKSSGESEVAHAERAKGTVALNLGRYEEAIEHLSQAYSLTQDPILLFNLGQAFRLAGMPDKAVASYSAFLRAAGPGTKYRTQFERAAAEIETIAPTLGCPVRMHVSKANQPGDSEQLDDLMNDLPRAAKPAAAPTPAPAPIDPPPAQEKVETPPVAKTAAPALTPVAPPAPAPAFAVSAQAVPPAEPSSAPIYKKAWFWSTVVAVLAVGGAATWYFTRPQNQTPGSTYGSTRVLP